LLSSVVIKVSVANKAIIRCISCEGQGKGKQSFVWENLKGINQSQDLYIEQDNTDVYWVEQALIFNVVIFTLLFSPCFFINFFY